MLTRIINIEDILKKRFSDGHRHQRLIRRPHQEFKDYNFFSGLLIFGDKKASTSRAADGPGLIGHPCEGEREADARARAGGRRHEGLGGGGRRGRRRATQGGGAGVACAVGQPARGVGGGARGGRRRRRLGGAPGGTGRPAAQAVTVQAGGRGGGGEPGHARRREGVGLCAIAVGHVRARRRGAESRVRPHPRRPPSRRRPGARRHHAGRRRRRTSRRRRGEAGEGEQPQPEEHVPPVIVQAVRGTKQLVLSLSSSLFSPLTDLQCKPKESSHHLSSSSGFGVKCTIRRRNSCLRDEDGSGSTARLNHARRISRWRHHSLALSSLCT